MRKNSKAQAMIKELAMQAKQRLKNLSYGTKEENQEIKKSILRENNLNLIANMECKKPEIVIKIINDSEMEENFNRRVYALLAENEDVINPLKQLIDTETFESFSLPEQEKYILELSDKYIKAREQYFSHYGY